VPVTSLVRMSKRPAREPFWSQSKRYRFDDPQGRFGVLYAGDSIETSFAESVIHERAVFLNDRCVIEQKDFLARQPVWYVCAKSHLRLADLTGTNLKALGLNNDISAGDKYAAPQRWSRAIHQASAEWDGIRFVSRQHNRRHAFAIFERTGLAKRTTRRLTTKERDELCATFNVTLI
jgi:hypothetical protein